MATVGAMEILHRLDFGAVVDVGAFDAQPVPAGYTEAVSQMEQDVENGSLPTVKEAFGAVRRTGVDKGRLARPGSALYLAVKHSHVDIVDYLLSESVQISSNHVKSATEEQNTAILELFVDHGWDIDEQME